MNKVALITGGSYGLGLSLARELGKQGYALELLARGQEKLTQAAESLRPITENVATHSADITDELALRRAYDNVKTRHGHIDFLILNAGVVTCRAFADHEHADSLRRDLDINLWGTVLSAWVLLPLVHEGGRILMVSSGFGLMGAAGYTTYAASKAGIVNFAEALRRELLHQRIAVHVTCPGDIDTPLFHGEKASMPAWMKAEDAPRGLLAPDVAARRILRKCTGNRLLVIINGEIKLLQWLTRLFPRRVRDAILDAMFPRPTEQRDGSGSKPVAKTKTS